MFTAYNNAQQTTKSHRFTGNADNFSQKIQLVYNSFF